MIILAQNLRAVNTDNYDYVAEQVSGDKKRLVIVRQDNGGDLATELTSLVDIETFNFYARSYFQAVIAGLPFLDFNV